MKEKAGSRRPAKRSMIVLDERMKTIALAVVGLKYSEWCKVREAVEKAFASERARIKLDNSEAVERLLRLEL
jgi:hypothetical protein